MLCVPLDDGESTRGVLKVCSSRPGAFGEADEAILGQLSGVVVAHMRRAIEYERKEYESRHDLLTGLGNRRAYEERLAKEVARAQRYGTPLTLLLLDLDGFKAVNDAHGHPAGDEVLRRVSQAFDRLRRADDCYRIGGDEFAIVLPQTGEPGGRAAAERVGDEVARRTAAHGVTATFGLAVYAEGDWSDLHALADARLMTAKRRR
jgi:diguanylate cyclase (GGDEF)-like protein